MVVLVVISMAHAAGVGVGTVAETPEPDHMANRNVNGAGISCSVACRSVLMPSNAEQQWKLRPMTPTVR